MTDPQLDNYNFEKLLDDIKLISRSVKIIINENDQAKRDFAGLLTDNLITRLYRDIKEMHETIPHTDGYGGYLNEKK